MLDRVDGPSGTRPRGSRSEALSSMDRVIRIHPSHMYVVASLPLQHQESLRSQLDTLREGWDAEDRQLEEDKEYVRTWKRCRPDHSDADIVSLHEQGRKDGTMNDVFGEDIPAALLALRWEHAEGQTNLAPQSASAVRQVDSCLLPAVLTDVWPRIFEYLTAKTPALRLEVANAWQRRTRPARVACEEDLVDWSVSEAIDGNEGLIADGLRGWEDLQLFMSVWVGLEDEITPASTFTNVARQMGLGGVIPPLVLQIKPQKLEDLAAAGYMVA